MNVRLKRITCRRCGTGMLVLNTSKRLYCDECIAWKKQNSNKGGQKKQALCWDCANCNSNCVWVSSGGKILPQGAKTSGERFYGVKVMVECPMFIHE